MNDKVRLSALFAACIKKAPLSYKVLNEELERWPERACCQRYWDVLPPPNKCPRCAVRRAWTLAYEAPQADEKVLAPFITSVKQSLRRKGKRSAAEWHGALANVVERYALGDEDPRSGMMLQSGIALLVRLGKAETDLGFVSGIRETARGNIAFVHIGAKKEVARGQLKDALAERRKRLKKAVKIRRKR